MTEHHPAPTPDRDAMGEDAKARHLAEAVATVARTAAALELMRLDLKVGELGPGSSDQTAQAAHAELLRRAQARLQETERALQAAIDALAGRITALRVTQPRD